MWRIRPVRSQEIHQISVAEPLEGTGKISSDAIIEQSKYRLCLACTSKYSEDISNCPIDGSDLIAITADALCGQLLAHRYFIETLIGRGGWASVYAALDRTLGRRVAIKVMHPFVSPSPIHVERFQREAKALCQVKHPNLCLIFDYGSLPDGRPYIVMEYVAGQPLSAVLENAVQVMDASAAVEILAKACDGLQAAHNAGLIHRDLKPSNIMLEAESLKILDFGLVTVVSDEEKSALTNTGETLGTPKYMSPEQCRGSSLTPSSDIYSLACVAFELLSGEPPFAAKTLPVEVMYAHVHQPAPLLQDIRRAPDCIALSHVLAKALSKRPEDRYASAEQFKQALLKAIASDAASSPGWTVGKALSKIFLRFKTQSLVTRLAIPFGITIAVCGSTYWAIEYFHHPEVPRSTKLAEFGKKLATAGSLVSRRDEAASRSATRELMAYAGENFPTNSMEMSRAFLVAAEQALLDKDPATALRLMDRALKSRQEAVGPNNSQMVPLLIHAGKFYGQLKERQLEIAALQRAIDIQKGNPQAAVEDTLDAVKGLSHAYEDLQRMKDDEEILLFGKQVAQNKLPPGNLDRLIILEMLQAHYYFVHNFQASEKVLDQALKEAELAPEKDRIALYGSAADFYHEDQQYEKALLFYRRLIELQTKYNDPSGMSINFAYGRIPICLEQMRQFSQVEQAFKGAIAYCREHPADGDGTVLNSLYFNYANFLRQTGRAQEARKIIEQATFKGTPLTNYH